MSSSSICSSKEVLSFPPPHLKRESQFENQNAEGLLTYCLNHIMILYEHKSEIHEDRKHQFLPYNGLSASYMVTQFVIFQSRVRSACVLSVYFEPNQSRARSNLNVIWATPTGGSCVLLAVELKHELETRRIIFSLSIRADKLYQLIFA